MLLDPTELPDLPPSEIREYMQGQDYLLKLEQKKINLDNLSDREIEEKRCFEKYYSLIVNNLDMSNVVDSYFSERGYLIGEILKTKKNNTTSEVKPKQLSKEIEEIKASISKLIKDNNLNAEIDFNAREKYTMKKMKESEEINKYNPNKNNDSKFIVSPISEPNIKKGGITNKFKYIKYKAEIKKH